LLPFRDSTFLNHLITVFRPRVDPLIVVLGHHAAQIAPSLEVQAGAVKVIVNANYKQGMLTSLQAGLGAVPLEASAIMFTLVDHPAVRPETIDRLIEEFQTGGSALAVPRYGERRGHPVILSRSVAGEVLALPPESSAKEVIRSHQGETLFLDADDPGVLCDVDLPSDYQALLGDRGAVSNP
ncbi:MAG: nucleotidyltransferase family protein, partial [Bryobacterales bacterium]